MNTPNTDTFRLIAASYTPFNTDRSIDFDSIPDYIRLLQEWGIREVFLNGTTGESLSLTVDERMRLLETWKQHTTDLRLIVHVGHNCLEDSCRLARHAEEFGVDAISAMSPTFFRPDSLSSLVDFAADIADAAPATQFYYYHIPSMTGVPVDMKAFIPQARERIPTFTGVKYTHENLPEFAYCQQRWGDELDLFFGRDELLLPALTQGARGAVGSFYGIIPSVFRKMIAAFEAEDLTSATQWSLFSNRVIDAFINVGNFGAGKRVMQNHGIGSGVLRLPLRSLDVESLRWLRSELAKLPTPDNEPYELESFLSIGSVEGTTECATGS